MDFPAMLDHQKVMYFFCDWGLGCWGWWNFGVVSFVCNETIPDRGCSLKRASMWHSLLTHPQIIDSQQAGYFPPYMSLGGKTTGPCWPVVRWRDHSLLFGRLCQWYIPDGRLFWFSTIYSNTSGMIADNRNGNVIFWTRKYVETTNPLLQKIHSMLAVSRPR